MNKPRSILEYVATLAILSITSILAVALYTTPSYTDEALVLQITGTPWAYLPYVAYESTPTPTHTPTPAKSDIRIEHVEYDPPGWDILNERVEFHNYGALQSMKNWTLEAAALRKVYNFKTDFDFGSNADVTLWVKGGNDTDTNIYWNSGISIWQDSDTATLRDDNGNIVDQVSW